VCTLVNKAVYIVHWEKSRGEKLYEDSSVRPTLGSLLGLIELRFEVKVRVSIGFSRDYG